MKKMSSAKCLLVVAVVVLFSVCGVSGDNSVPPKCDPPCQQLPPPNPPFSSDPSYGAPPPPADYSIYGAPPPPAHKDPAQKKCPPAAPQVQCCNPPYPYYTYAPPIPYTYGPPSPYTYMPYGEGGRLFVPVLGPFMMMILSSFIFLF